jgi:hypothetical protein
VMQTCLYLLCQISMHVMQTFLYLLCQISMRTLVGKVFNFGLRQSLQNAVDPMAGSDPKLA